MEKPKGQRCTIGIGDLFLVSGHGLKAMYEEEIKITFARFTSCMQSCLNWFDNEATTGANNSVSEKNNRTLFEIHSAQASAPRFLKRWQIILQTGENLDVIRLYWFLTYRKQLLRHCFLHVKNRYNLMTSLKLSFWTRQTSIQSDGIQKLGKMKKTGRASGAFLRT